MRFLDLVLVAVLMIGATLWLAAAMSAEPPPSSKTAPYLGPDPGSSAFIHRSAG